MGLKTERALTPSTPDLNSPGEAGVVADTLPDAVNQSPSILKRTNTQLSPAVETPHDCSNGDTESLFDYDLNDPSLKNYPPPDTASQRNGSTTVTKPSDSNQKPANDSALQTLDGDFQQRSADAKQEFKNNVQSTDQLRAFANKVFTKRNLQLLSCVIPPTNVLALFLVGSKRKYMQGNSTQDPKDNQNQPQPNNGAPNTQPVGTAPAFYSTAPITNSIINVNTGSGSIHMAGPSNLNNGSGYNPHGLGPSLQPPHTPGLPPYAPYTGLDAPYNGSGRALGNGSLPGQVHSPDRANQPTGLNTQDSQLMNTVYQDMQKYLGPDEEIESLFLLDAKDGEAYNVVNRLMPRDGKPHRVLDLLGEESQPTQTGAYSRQTGGAYSRPTSNSPDVQVEQPLPPITLAPPPTPNFSSSGETDMAQNDSVHRPTLKARRRSKHRTGAVNPQSALVNPLGVTVRIESDNSDSSEDESVGSAAKKNQAQNNTNTEAPKPSPASPRNFGVKVSLQSGNDSDTSEDEGK